MTSGARPKVYDTELVEQVRQLYERVKGMRHILVGKHIRVSRQALDAWLKEQECYSVVTVYGTRESSSTDGGSRKRRTAQTARRRIASTEAKAACESARQAYEKARCRLDDAWESARRLGAT